MSMFSDEPGSISVSAPATVLNDDLSLVEVMSTLSQQLSEIPEGRRLLRLGLVRLGEQALTAELANKAINVSPHLAIQVLQAEARYMNTVLDILARNEFPPRLRQRLAQQADLIFEDMDVDLRTVLRAANRELAKVIVRAMATERPLSILDRFLY